MTDQNERVEAAARALRELRISPFGPGALPLLSVGRTVRLSKEEAEEFARAALDAADAVTATPETECEPVESYTCACRTPGCGCRLTNPPTHFHDDGRRHAGTLHPETVGEGERERLRLAWHDVNCPEGTECRSRWVHSQWPGWTVVADGMIDAILAAGYVSPETHAGKVDEGKAEAWDEAITAVGDQVWDGAGPITNPYRTSGGA